MNKFEHKKIDKKWQRYWEQENIFKTKEDKGKNKFYCLDMFPYPSGAGLHVGHPEGYTATDIVCRYRRMKYNENILHPMGFDSFGLPTENYAIKVGKNPKEITQQNIKRFTEQLKSFGFSYDWERQVATSEPEYYKWTQWMFRELYKKGLAYKKEAPVNWCESCKTVLAREQVVNGKCERCKNEVIQKNLSQWFFKITAYADELLVDIEKLDWPEPIKALQRNWIGKSTGAEVDFKIKDSGEKLKVFTTRPDTLFGATFMVIAPEHPLINNFQDTISNFQEIEKYVKQAQKKNELERTDLNKDKTGIKIEGLQAINPVNNKAIPIFVADYVMMSYGTGAIMAVPAHDTRDWEFAKKYDIEIREVIRAKNKNCIIIHGSNQTEEGSKSGQPENLRHWKPWLKKNLEKNGIKVSNELYPEDWNPNYEKWKKVFEKNNINKNTILVAHSAGTAFILRWLNENKKKVDKLILVAPSIFKSEKYVKLKSDFKDFKYNASLKKYFNQLVVFYSNNDKTYKIIESAKEIHKKLGGELIELKNKGHFVIKDMGTEKFPELLAKIFEVSFAFTEINSGEMVNSDFLNGLKPSEAIKKIIKWLVDKGLGKEAVNYKLRDWLISRQRYWGAPIPLIYCEQCAQQKYNYVLLHGFGGNSQSNFLPWLKSELEKKGHQANCLDLPNTDNPTEDEQVSFVLKNFKFNKKTILFGHSLGAVDAMKVVEKLDGKIAGLVLAGGFVEPKFKDNERIFKDKYDWQFDFNKIKDKVGWIKILSSIDDYAVPIEQGRILAQQLEAELFEVKGNEPHFLGEVEPDILDKLLVKGEYLVEEKKLPVELPDDVDFRPTGESPLVESKKFHQVKCPVCGATEGVRREVDTMDTFVCSSWYFLRYADPKNKQAPFDKKKVEQWLPVDLYVGGAEHAVMHLMYARFFTKALADMGYLNFREPFLKLRNQGMILAEDGKKMSKSLGNVINPDEVVAEYGADTFRMYEMFMGPLEDTKPWNTNSIAGVRNFLDRVWRLYQNNWWYKLEENKLKMNKEFHKVVKKVTDDIENMKFNTAISQLMMLVNFLTMTKGIWEKEGTNMKEESADTKFVKEKFLILLSPFAPHITEELWEKLGHKKSIIFEDWPEYDKKLIQEDEVEIVVQVNGKVRDKIKLPVNITEAEIKVKVLALENIKKWLLGKEPKKIIYVPGKLISLVV